MTRKLVFLNIILVALLGAAGWQLRLRWLEEREREAAVARRRLSPPPVPPVTLAEPVKPIDAPSYTEVATKMLFAKDRNPNVILDAPPPPPPPPPVPPFPVAYGLMDLGTGPTVFLADAPGAPQKGYRPGSKVGPFMLTSIKGRELTFEWQDKTFVKTMEELKPKPGQVVQAASSQQYGPGAAAAPAAAAGASQPEITTVGNNHTLSSDESAKKQAEIQKQMAKDGGPGLDVGATNRACAAGDTSPSGTVQGGYRKVMRPSMFGQSCYWEPVR